ncbi:MAG: UDP-N-acetylglucosamine 2-epimerase (non-hydrolyzing) [Actinomycetota bacterium]|nr:UDP-N-acetylglucosamine 2-epimerase (non-hydrolyzing) [Actinomycetota bacterium]
MTSRRRVVSVVGTRPNYMKIAPVAAAIRERDDLEHVLVHTGQHYDESMSRVFFEELGIGPPDHMLEVGSGTHGVQTARVMERLEPLLSDLGADIVLAPGDVNSTMAATLVACKLGMTVGHVEAGLRSFDRSMPEEINRVVADSVADLLFTHSPEARTHLLAEGAPEKSIFPVGNTMIDTLVAMLPRVREADLASRLGFGPREYLLVTLHRPALTDGPLLATALAELVELAEELPVVFPVHPRTRSRIEAAGLTAPGVTLLDPLAYIDFMSLVHSAAALLTDSGGVQEETTFLGIPCFTLRDNTERPVTVTAGTNVLLGLAPERISEIPTMLAERGNARPEPIPGWDGAAGRRLVDVLALEELPSRAASLGARRPGWAGASTSQPS